MAATTITEALKVTKADYGRTTTVNPKRLKIDPRYQRTVKNYMVHVIKSNFSPRLFEPITVAERSWTSSDFLWVVDGGHRLTAALQLELKEVPVRVIKVNSPEEEANLFADLNQNRISVSKASAHRAHVFANDALAVNIEKALNEVGFKLVPEREGTLLRSAACMYSIYNKGEMSEWAHPQYEEAALSGEKLVQATLETVNYVWGSKPATKKAAFDNNTLKAIAIFLSAYWPLIDNETFVDVMDAMSETTPDDLHAKAARKSSSANNFVQRAIEFTHIFNATQNRRLRVAELAGE